MIKDSHDEQWDTDYPQGDDKQTNILTNSWELSWTTRSRDNDGRSAKTDIRTDTIIRGSCREARDTMIWRKAEETDWAA